MESTQNVAFSDSTETTIIAWSLAPIVDKETYPNTGTVSIGDERYKAFWDAYPMMQSLIPAPTAS